MSRFVFATLPHKSKSIVEIIKSFRKAITVMMIAVLLCNPAAAATVEATPVLVSFGQDLRYTWYSSGWASFFGFDLQSLSHQGAGSGRGKGAPRQARPDKYKAETNEERKSKISKVKIYPGDVEVKVGEQVAFNAFGEDSEGNAIGGLEVKWSALHEENRNKISMIRGGIFSSPVAGTYKVTADIAGVKNQVTVKLVGENQQSNEKAVTGEEVDSRDFRKNKKKAQSSLLAPAHRNSKLLLVNKNTRRKELSGSLGGLVRVPRIQAQLEQYEDESGFNSSNQDSFDDVGSERGDMAGRAIDGGAGSGNFQFSAPLVSLDGRGIDLNLALNYNSRLWHKSDHLMTFDIDRDWIPGWNLGFGKISMQGDTFMLTDADGTRHPYKGNRYIIRENSIYERESTFEAWTTDGTFINYFAYSHVKTAQENDKSMIRAWAALPNGTKIEYGAPANYAMYPTRITDAHGNYITITYRNNAGPDIETITDTLGRAIRFHYDGDGSLSTITVPGLNGQGERQVVRLNYKWINLADAGSNNGFTNVTPIVRSQSVRAIRAIYYPATGTGYWFDDPDSYSRYGMIRKVSEHRSMTIDSNGYIYKGVMSHEVKYNNPSMPGYSDLGGALSDTPTYTEMTEDWAKRQTDSVPITRYEILNNGNRLQTIITRPDGVKVVQITDNDQNSSTYGMLIEDITYAPDGKVLKRSTVSWIQGAYDSPRPEWTYVYDEKGQMTKTYYGYGGRFNAPTEVGEHNYAGQYIKRTQTEYLNSDDYIGKLGSSGTKYAYWEGQHIFNLPKLIEVFGSEGRISYTAYEYDGNSLIGTPNVPQYDISYNPNVTSYEDCGYKRPNDCPLYPAECPLEYRCDTRNSHYHDSKTKFRGNVTKVMRYADAANLDGGLAIVENYQYDITGNLRIQNTACCEQTTFNYTENTKYAWPESIVRGSSGDASAQNTASSVYDFNTGLVIESYDSNGKRSNTEYSWHTLRPVREFTSTGAYVYHTYHDSEMEVHDFVYESGKSGDDYASHTFKYLDGKGQVQLETAYSWNNGLVKDEVHVEYDNFGRVKRQSKPFRVTVDPIVWTEYEYDYLDRPVKTVAPDGTAVQRFYNEVTAPSAATSNVGQTVRSRDAWGRERWGRFDEQNRLIEVVEPYPSGNGSVASGGLVTQYQYDTPGNLVRVNQGAQTRYFKYDSLGRLTNQKLAERDGTLDDAGNWVGSGTWSDRFFYDTRSNLTGKIDARGVRSQFNYDNDPLNRLKSVQYDKGSVPVHLRDNILNANNVTYAYLTEGDKMRVKNVFVDGGMGNQAIEYDVESRVSQVYQTFGGREAYPVVTNYLWDTLDRVKEVRYPQQYGAGDARKVVVHNYDLASRLTELKYDGTTMASNPVFNASNQVTSLAVGNQIQEKYDFDPKTGLLLSQQVNKGSEKLVDLKYNYTLNNDPNNNGAKTGQLTSITDLKNTARNRAYNYDPLGRLVKARGGANATSGPDWEQVYSYDRYGNKSIQGSGSGSEVWVDDALPEGAVAEAEGGDSWSWRNWGPIPKSGEVSHVSNIASGQHQHAFRDTTQPLQINAGDKLYAWVYLDPANTPSQVILQWREPGKDWNHRAYWGTDNWKAGESEAYHYMGALPQAGNWVKLEVPASAVGLEGLKIYGMGFTLWGGRVAWDMAGVEGTNRSEVWVDDTLPEGAVAEAEGGDSWSWRNWGTVPKSGEVSHVSNIASGQHQHFFINAEQKLQINAGDKLYTWVYLDPVNTPSQVILQWRESEKGWDHRAYWGTDNWKSGESEAYHHMGPLPEAGKWVKLEVPASSVGLEGKALNGMAFTLWGGRAAWDKAGKTGTDSIENQAMSRDGLTGLSYNDKNNRIVTSGFTYDPAGNQTTAIIDTTGKQQKYVYDSANRLSQVLDSNGSLLATYVYGSSNQRIMSTEGGVTTYYASEGGQVIAEYEAVGANGLQWKMSYVYMGGRLLATDQAGGICYHHPDTLGTRLVTDASDGAVISENLAMPFGTAIPNGPNLGGDNSWQNPTRSNHSKKKFTSYDRSDATGLDYAVNRQYSSAQGRFTQVDPIGMSAVSLDDPQTMNLYSYCANDPINRLDPDGTSWFGKLFGWIGKILKWVAIAVIVVAVVLTIAQGPWAAHLALKLSAWVMKHSFLSSFLGLNALKMQGLVMSLSALGESAAMAGFWHHTAGAVSNYMATQQNKEQKRTLKTEAEMMKEAVKKAEKGEFLKCYEKWQFSSLFEGTRAHSAVKSLEVGSDLSLIGDGLATIKKALGPKPAGVQAYASGLNWIFRRLSKGATRGWLVRNIGNRVTPALAATGAFTGGYNASIAAQCKLGVLK